MSNRRITASFSLFGSRKVSDAERKKAIQQVRRAINTPMVRERIMLAEQFGYFEKRPTNDDPENPPASRTVRISIDNEGVVTHVEEVLRTPTGKKLDAMEHSGIGGWSWAFTDGSGKPDWRRFTGLDYKRYPNLSSLLGRTVSMFEAAPAAGRESVVKTGTGDEVRTQFVALDVDDLIISNMPDGRINPDFPPELQPRDRTSLKSKLQVLDISKTLDLATLGDSDFSGNGAPIIGPDHVVESGNGRVMGIMRAYASGSADQYRQSVRAAASDYGLSQSDIDGLAKPVLVRVRLDDVDRVKFAVDSNIKPGETKMFEDAALLEAAKGKKTKLFDQATTVAEIIATIHTHLNTGGDEQKAIYVGSLIKALRAGRLPQKEYVKRVKAIMGGSYKEASERFYLFEFIQWVVREIGYPGFTGLSSKDLFTRVILKGLGWDLPEKWKAWEDSTNQKDRQRNAQILADAMAPFVKDGKRSVSTIDWAQQWVSKITGSTYNWKWYHDRGEFVERMDMSVDERKAYYLKHRDAGRDLLPDFHKTVDESIEAVRDIVLNNEAWFKSLNQLNGGKVPHEAWQRIEYMLTTGQLAPSNNGKDGFRSMRGWLNGFYGGKSFDFMFHDALKPANELRRLAARALKDFSPISNVEAREQAMDIKIDPKLEQLYDTYEGPGQIRDWISECFHVIGGCPASLKGFEMLPAELGDRAHASAHDQVIRLSYRNGKSVVWHEIGHHYEFSTPGALEAATGYLFQRATSQNLVYLKDYAGGAYGKDEAAIQDGFYSPYVGKVYGGSVKNMSSSEVFSSGVEYLSGLSQGAESIMNREGLVEFVLGFITENHNAN